MKVSIVVSELSGSKGLRAALLGQALERLGYRVQLSGPFFQKDIRLLVSGGLDCQYIPTERRFPGLLSAFGPLLKMIDGDIIYALKPKLTSLGLALIKQCQSHRPIILDIDDWESALSDAQSGSHPSLLSPNHPLYLKALEQLICRAKAVTVHTTYLQKRFGGVMVPNGKDMDHFDPARYEPDESRQRYGLSGYRVVMFPGVLRGHKGIEDVLMALDQINEPDMRLVIVGGGHFDRTIFAKWDRWLIEIPRVPYDEMPRLVAAAHVVVVPQRDTPVARAQFPLKLTDGMAMAKPVLASRVGDIPEILGGTGYLVDPEHPDQIAQQLRHIFQNQEEAASRAAEARERCKKLYSIEAMSEALQDVMAQVCPSR